jgi:protein-S-isoprenylcysteine O-methyltransferase Ste14
LKFKIYVVVLLVLLLPRTYTYLFFHSISVIEVIQSPSYNLFAWTAGGIWCWVNGFCIWTLSTNINDRKSLDVLDGVGVFLFVCGLLIETISDLQKYFFNIHHESGKNNKFINHGLWKWSRHPNYFGEITLWYGISIICVGGTNSIWLETLSFNNAFHMFIIFVTPIWSMLFLSFTSLMLLEKNGNNKWGDGNATETGNIWRKYKRETPILFPNRLPLYSEFFRSFHSTLEGGQGHHDC